jgi:hypothetical protein
MTSRFQTLIGSLSLEEQKPWVPNQVVRDPDTWTTSHLLHLKSQYDVLVNQHGYIIQEMYTMQDPSAQTPPLQFLLLPPLHYLHKANVRNQETFTNIRKSKNNRILQQLVFHTQKIIPSVSIQDLDPPPCTDNDHVSVLPFEMTAIEPGDCEIPTLKLTWKPLG